MWNVLKRKSMQKYFVTFLQGYPLKNISVSFDMHIEKLYKKICFFQQSAKKTVRGGGLRTLRTGP